MNQTLSGAVELAYFMSIHDIEARDTETQLPEDRKDLLNRVASTPPAPRIAAAVVDELQAQLARGM